MFGLIFLDKMFIMLFFIIEFGNGFRGMVIWAGSVAMRAVVTVAGRWRGTTQGAGAGLTCTASSWFCSAGQHAPTNIALSHLSRRTVSTLL